MTRLLSELEIILQQLVVEHRKLLAHMEQHEAAMKKFQLEAMDDAARLQEGSRLRIANLEIRRRTVVGQLAKVVRIEGELTIRKLAALHPPRAEALLKLREELKGLVGSISARTRISGKIAGAVLGHLNTVVRLLAGAVEKAGLYTKNGIPQVSTRIGMMEAVG